MISNYFSNVSRADQLEQADAADVVVVGEVDRRRPGEREHGERGVERRQRGRVTRGHQHVQHVVLMSDLITPCHVPISPVNHHPNLFNFRVQSFKKRAFFVSFGLRRKEFYFVHNACIVDGIKFICFSHVLRN